MNAEEIERDLRPFADPATDVTVSASTKLVRVKLVRDAVQHAVSVDLPSGKVKVRYEGTENPVERRFISLRSLLASKEYADAQAMADNQRRVLSSLMVDDFIEPEGTLDGRPLSQAAFDESALLASREAKKEPLSLILIDGAAGVGKTSLIARLVARRAGSYGREAVEPPVLHVANRGRRLASLDELIALSIQLIRGRFTYDQVPALIRQGVIQIAIDGFDELVDAEGYADTWAVLREFLSEVGSGGPILLAGRDTFFELTKFRERLHDIASRTAISHASLSPITPDAAKEWLKRQGWSEEDVNSAQASDLLKEGSYALRPFFLQEVAKLEGLDALLETLSNPRDYLVGRFIEREAGLITQRIELDRATASEHLWHLFELIALEMAESETEAVDLPFLQLAVDVTFSPVLSDTDLAKLRHKAGSFALMDVDVRQDFRRFPHTEISNHFLASALLRQIRAKQVTRFLRRGFFGTDLLTVIGEKMITLENAQLAEVRRNLAAFASSEVGSERLSENSASMLIGSAVGECPPDFTLVGLAAGDAVLFGSPGPVRVADSSVIRLDCRGADLSDIAFSGCRVTTLVVDDATVLGNTAPEVLSLIRAGHGSTTACYDPVEIAKWLLGHMKPKDISIRNPEAIRLLERVCRVFLRQFFVKDDQLDPTGRYLQDDLWPSIESILSTYGRVRRNDSKDASGRPGEFVHLINAGALLARASQEDREIWTAVGSIG